MGEECNRLAMYLAQHGVSNWDRMVSVEAPFGRVKELWYNDMGLGPVGPQFEMIREVDLVDGVVQDNVEGEEDEHMI